MPHVEVEKDVKIFYQLSGRDDAPRKILFVMGWITSHKSWELQVNYFSALEEYQCCAFDNRGIGFSDVPAGPYTMDVFATDVVKLVNHLAWDKFHLVGVSMGGMISQHVALRIPTQILSLSLISTRMFAGLFSSLPSAFTFWTFAKRIVWSQFRNPDEIAAYYGVEVMFPKAYLSSLAPDGKTQRQRLYELGLARRKDLPPVTPVGFKAQLAAVRAHGLNPEHVKQLNDADFKILIMTGDTDEMVSHQNSIAMSKLLSKSRLVVFPGAGHALLEQFSGDVNKFLQEFFQSVVIPE